MQHKKKMWFSMNHTQEVVFKQEKYTNVLGIYTPEKKRQIEILSEFCQNLHNERFHFFGSKRQLLKSKVET